MSEQDRPKHASPERPGLAALRGRLEGARGPEFWRSLEELAGDEAFQELLHREFPRQASEWTEGLDRRRFLQLAGASLALAGLACTRQPLERIVPYVRQPEEIIPGRPQFYATAMTLGGYALGLLVESHEGRPTKVEGNPQHPASLGATNAFAQAAVLGLYDPDRSQLLLKLGEISTWASFLESLRGRLQAQRSLKGAGLRILTETVTSPTLAAQIRSLLALYPKAKWHQYEPAGRDMARLGARMAFGRFVETRFDFGKADVVFSLDADFPAAGPGAVRYTRDFTDRRRRRDGRAAQGRLYVVESAPTLAGTLADHHVTVRAGEVPVLAQALAAALEVPGVPRPAAAPASPFVTAAAADLRAHAGRSLVLAGEYAPPEVHALAHAMNHHLGNAGATVLHTDPVEAEPVDQAASLGELVGEMRAGHVDILAILGGNPVFTAPADFRFGEALGKVPLRIHLNGERDETAEYCHWHVPEAHFLEAWSDARAHDGTATVIQPLIAPLYGGRSAHELLSVFTDDTPRSGYDTVRDFWRGRTGTAGFEAFWRKALHDGVVPGTALPSRTLPLLASAVPEAVAAIALAGAAEAKASLAGQETCELVFRPDPTIHDGRFANNGWLQELPKPLSSLTWDNAAFIGPAAAARTGLVNGAVVEIVAGGKSVQAPVWILPGHPDGSMTVTLGYGRRKSGRVAKGAGFDPYVLRDSTAPWLLPKVSFRPTGEHRALAATQHHFNMEGRDLVRVATLEEMRADPECIKRMGETPPKDQNLYPGFAYPGQAWGMAIDLSACTGCNACVVACQAENNIPVVGKEQVLRGREMHWLRVDRYYQGDPEDPETHHQPVMCMHCEQAPCEVVCPVGATNHNSEGLNVMVYNRCVGTRYCSNNCPYKVRRFNFLKYNDETTPVLKLLHNPDVTVRSRGVMEKCTYCVQRINEARIDSEREGRDLRDGEITTACQQACPSQAIVFGDINDGKSRVSAWKSEPSGYGLLEGLNTRPRTTYLAKLRNPNPALRPDKGRDRG